MSSQELHMSLDNLAKVAALSEEARLLLQLLCCGNGEIERGEFSDAEDVFARLDVHSPKQTLIQS